MDVITNLLDNNGTIKPIPTGVEPNIKPNSGIKAIIFDIYGTLLISASGDIEEAGINHRMLEKALKKSEIEIMPTPGMPKIEILNQMLQMHFNTVKDLQEQRKAEGAPYPEINILDVCSTVLNTAESKGWIKYTGEKDCEKTIFIFELLSNPVSPMPGLKTVVETIHKAGFPMGIVSNAQFYTPITMNYYLSGKWEKTDHICYFQPDLSVYSYKLLRGKPDVFLYEQLIEPLKNMYNLKPEEVLFVGNDMLKDVYAANAVGFKTVLFAGDNRSLRMREDHHLTKKLSPDYVITDLQQLLQILNIS